MPKLVYSVAMSLDGKIAGPAGDYDWIPDEPAIDWEAFMGRFDTVVMGRGTWEAVTELPRTLPTYVASTTLEPVDDERVTVVRDDVAGLVRRLRAAASEKHVWLMGGGILFRHLLEHGLVDEVEVAIVPKILGNGIPFLPPWEGRAELALRHFRSYPTGIVLLRYECLAAPSTGDAATGEATP